jgi:hypothetical protein
MFFQKIEDIFKAILKIKEEKMEETIKKEPSARKRKLSIKKLMKCFWDVAEDLGLNLEVLSMNDYILCRNSVLEEERKRWLENPKTGRGFHEIFFYPPKKRQCKRKPLEKEKTAVNNLLKKKRKKRKKKARKKINFDHFGLSKENKRASMTVVKKGKFFSWSAKNIIRDLYAAKRKIDLAGGRTADLKISVKLNTKPRIGLPSVFSGVRSLNKGDNVFVAEWSHKRYLRLYLLYSDLELIELFSKILGFYPCRWIYANALEMLVFKWDYNYREQSLPTIKEFAAKAEGALSDVMGTDGMAQILFFSKPKIKRRRGRWPKSIFDAFALKEEKREEENLLKAMA